MGSRHGRNRSAHPRVSRSHRLSTQRVFLLGAALVSVILIVIFGDLPGHWLFVGELQNGAHVPAFALIATLLAIALRHAPGLLQRAPQSRYIATLVIVTAIGAAIEFIQGAFHRDMSLDDVFHDFLGGVIGLGFLHGARFEPASRTFRNASICAAVLAVLIAVFPVVRSAAAYLHRNQQFPTLVSFDSPLDRYFLFDCARRENLSRLQGSQLLVQLDSSCRKQIGIAEPYPDWTGYSHLNIDIANTTDQAIRLTIRIEDARHDQEFSDRFNHGFTLEAHERKNVVIALEDVRRAPATRPMDMHQIYWINIFASRSEAHARVALHRMWLD